MATFGFLVAMLDFAEKNARLDLSTFLILCYSGYLSGNKYEEKASVAIVCLYPIFSRHDRRTATKYCTHIRIDMGLIRT